MDTVRMQQLVDQHLAAELAGDTEAAVEVYTNDVVHDVVGSPTGPVEGPEAARAYYDELLENTEHERFSQTQSWFGEDFAVVEHACAARVTGQYMGIPGDGREIVFRLLHVWEFRDDAISREIIWLDAAAIVTQLTAEGESPTAND